MSVQVKSLSTCSVILSTNLGPEFVCIGVVMDMRKACSFPRDMDP